MDSYKLNILDIENIVILNDELKKFLHNIFNTINYFIDKNDELFEVPDEGICINFIYKDLSIDLYKDDEIKKLSIINKKTHHYEFFYENHEKILIEKCELKNISIDEISDLFKQIYYRISLSK